MFIMEGAPLKIVSIGDSKENKGDDTTNDPTAGGKMQEEWNCMDSLRAPRTNCGRCNSVDWRENAVVYLADA